MLHNPSVLTRVPLPMRGGALQGEVISFSNLEDDKEHLAISFLNTDEAIEEPVLVRIHSECLTGDVFQSARCDCGQQLEEAVDTCSMANGLILYLRQEGRGVGLYTKLKSYALQDKGADTFEANRLLHRKDDERDYKVAAQMLGALGIQKIHLLSNNPNKVKCLKELGIKVLKLVPTRLYINPHNYHYLLAKKNKAGHTLSLDEFPSLNSEKPKTLLK